MSGLSLRGLEEKIHGAVTYNALSKYEKGEMMPGSEVLMAVAEATSQSYGFFFRPTHSEIAEVKFRKKTKLSKKAEKSIRGKAQDFFERYFEVERILGLESEFKNPLKGKQIATLEDAENAAVAVRREWKLGLNALPNLHEMLENNRIKVYEGDSDENFDGFSGWIDDTPVVVVSKRLNNQCLTRKRNTLAHELGHLLLKGQIVADTPPKDEEKIVHRFSAALLLPQEVFIGEFGKHRRSFSLEELIEIKITYGISIAAQVYRAYDLGCISEATSKRFWITYSKKGWRGGEPGDDLYIGNETSNRFKQLVYRAVAEGQITRSKAAELLNANISEFREAFELFE